MRTSWRLLVAGLLLSIGCLVRPSGEGSRIVGGTPTNLRPEIGVLTVLGGSCTAELVSPRHIVTAAHCFHYQTGPQIGTFRIFDLNGVLVGTFNVDFSWSLGVDVGALDIAFGRLTALVPVGDATPMAFGGAPIAGDVVSVFGYGCIRRPNESAFTKRFVDYVFASTALNCQGDSGGPRVLGSHAAGGAIWAINSGYEDSDESDQDALDINADASRFGRPMLEAVENVGGTRLTDLASGFPSLASSPAGARIVAGDFNADGDGDLAAVGARGWASVPVAFGDGNGGFTVTNQGIGDFAQWAPLSRSQVVGDYDGNGRADIALVGGGGVGSAFTTIPIAFSNGDGSFVVTNQPPNDPNFPRWAVEPGAVSGDFDGDGDDDLALLGGGKWGTIPVGRSNRDGTFTVTNEIVENFPHWSQVVGGPVSGKPCGGNSTITERRRPTAIVGDYDGDGDDDIALSGALGWATIPVALSNRVGGFGVTNRAAGEFPYVAGGYRVRIVGGDFNGDGNGDLAALGGVGWATIDFAFSDGAGGFRPGKLPAVRPFPEWATCTDVLAIQMDADGRTDFALVGGADWGTVPVLFSQP